MHCSFSPDSQVKMSYTLAASSPMTDKSVAALTKPSRQSHPPHTDINKTPVSKLVVDSR